jgi:Na+/melibiose symporter-like transporter
MSLSSAAPVTRTVSSARRFSTLTHVQLAALWFALFAQWMTVVPVIVPDQIARLLGPNAALKEGVSGSVIAAGAAIALVVAPLAGALSDRCVAPGGRRRPFIVTGMLGTCVALALLAPFDSAGTVLLYTLAFLHLQFWWNWAAGAYAGLVPDVVPPGERTRASAWLNVMTVLGSVTGNAVLLALYKPGHLGAALGAFIAIALVCLYFTVRGKREPTPVAAHEPIAWRAFVRSFYLDPHAHANFYWVLVTRLFANMGIWSIFTFMLFYLQDAIGLHHPVDVLNALLGAGAVLAIPASVWGARLADRHGVVAIVRVTSWIMAGAAVGYVLLALHPALVLVVPVALVFSAAYGAYQSVDWALALEVLPTGSSAGKDMGIWHISMVLPQILGPAGTGWMLSWVKGFAGAGPAYVVAFAIAAAWFVLAAWLVSRVRLAPGAAVAVAAAGD